MKRKKITILVSVGILLILMLVFGAQLTAALTCEWVGGIDSNWETPGNWNNCNSGIPGSSDTVIINANTTINLNSTTTIGNLSLGNALGTTSPVLNFNYDAVSNGALILTSGNLNVYQNAQITHPNASTNTIIGRIVINITNGNLNLQGRINAEGKGYTGLFRGSGYGPGGGAVNGPGGTHGGNGHLGNNNRYGSLSNPIDLGSGGGGDSISHGTGKSGGGSITLNISGNLIIDNGSINASGDDNTSTLRLGGGAGGSINITASTISGTGSIISHGGDTNTFGTTTHPGGGGRISLKYATNNTFTGSVSARGGLGDAGTAENGTVIVYNSTTDHLYIEHSQIWSANPSLEGPTHSYSNITVRENVNWQLRSYHTTSTNGFGFTFNTANFTTEQGSVLNLVGTGYIGVYRGTGNGPGGGTVHGNGGSYGGLGANGTTTYGLINNPIHLGSAGGGKNDGTTYGAGMSGGGAIIINASNNVQNDGRIDVSGNPSVAVTLKLGGGSGGSINITTKNMSGSGLLIADGGDTIGTNTSTFPGGGGRIAIKYSSTNSYSGTIRAEGGLGDTLNAENGTVFILDSTNNNLFINYSQVWRTNLDGPAVTYNNITVAENVNLEIKGYYTTNTNGYGFSITASNLTVENGGVIDLIGNGYRGNFATTGSGPGGGVNNGRGATYGGIGLLGPITYGSLTNPVDLGSAGGGLNAATAKRTGRAGGGALILNISNTLTVNGSIDVSGETSIDTVQGAGSGGSLNITTKNFSGNGTAKADGGSSGGFTDSYPGGGGRIRLRYSGSYNFSGSITANGGTSSMGNAENGTVYIFDIATDTLHIKNTQYWNPNIEGEYFTMDNVIVENNATLYLKSIMNLTNQTGRGIKFNVSNFTVNNGASVSARGFGFPGNFAALGNGPGGGRNNGRGGSYGGLGVLGYAIYGDQTHPIDLGSAGGGYNGNDFKRTGASGGGNVYIYASSNIVVNGTISSDGDTATQNVQGAGSAGGVYLVTTAFSGSGLIRANGGNDSGLNSSFAGGGGRVAVYYKVSNNFSGTAQALGGTGINGTAQNGSVYIVSGQPSQILLDPNSAPVSGTINLGSRNAGYYTKVIEMPNGTALMHNVAEVGNQQSVDTAYDSIFVSCLNIRCDNQLTTVDPGGYGQTRPASEGISGAWGLLYVRNSTGLPVYISNNPGNNGRDMRPLFATNSNFSNATMGSPIYSNTEPIMFISGVVRNDFTPFLVFERLNVGSLDSYSCNDDACSSGSFRSLVNGATRPSVSKLADGRPVISFYKSDTKDLGLYICSNSACTSGTVTYPATNGDVGQYNSIILRADGTPGIAYSTNNGLRFIDCNNSACSTYTDYSTYDELAVMGQNLSVPMIALDQNNNPIILSRAARGKGTSTLSYYICYNPGCSEGRFRTLLKNEDDIGLYASILRKSDGTLIIPYKDNTNKTIQFFAGIPRGSSKVSGVSSTIDIVQVSRQEPLNPVSEQFGDPQTQNFSTAVVDIRVEKATGNIPIADIVTTFEENNDMNWSLVSADSDIVLGKSVVNNLTSAPGTNATHTLYVPRNPGVNAVRICPDAAVLADVTLECSNGYELDPERHSIVSIVNIGGNEYFKVLGLTGTGGLGIVAGTPSMRIELENEAPNATSDTEIWFATPTDIIANTTIQVSYDISFTGGSALTASDITVTCDTDGLAPISGSIMTTFILLSSLEGFLEINTGTDSCTDWIVIDINGAGGNHLTNPSEPGNYSFSVMYDVGSTGTPTAQGATLAYIQDENDVQVTAYVPPVIDMELYETNNDTLLNNSGVNACELGVLSINTVSTCTYDIGTGTNNLAGLSIYIQSDGNLRDGSGNAIDACTGINCNGLGSAGVSAGEEEYGIYISELGNGEYFAADSFGIQHQAIPTTSALFATTNSTGSGTTTGSTLQRLEVTHAVSISLATVQGSYSHVVTYTAYTN